MEEREEALSNLRVEADEEVGSTNLTLAPCQTGKRCNPGDSDESLIHSDGDRSSESARKRPKRTRDPQSMNVASQPGNSSSGESSKPNIGLDPADRAVESGDVIPTPTLKEPTNADQRLALHDDLHDKNATRQLTTDRRPVDKDSKAYRIILLQEQIAATESSLMLLRNHRGETMRDLERCNNAQRRAVARITSLQKRRVLLRRRRTRQTKLFDSIRASLAQTKTRRQRLADCATVEEMENIGKAETNQAEKQQIALSAEAQSSDMEIDDDDGSSINELAPIECVVQWPDPDAFWRHSGPYLLMALSSAEQIRRAMDVISDQVTDQSRRGMLRNTCLDIGILLADDVNREPLRTTEGNEGPSIQPNVPLCPYEMAGSCADPECSYQHLEERPLGSVIPRELLPLPELKLTAPTAKPKNATQRQKLVVSYADGSGPDNSIEDSNNFVALPRRPDENVYNTDDDEAAPQLLFWWNDESNAGSTDVPTQFSRFGINFSAKVGERMLIERQDSDLVLQAMILDCSAFSLHAGRLDIYETLRAAENGLLSSALGQVGEVSMDINATRNIFERSFVVQLCLAAIGLILETSFELNESLNTTTIPGEFLRRLSVLSTDDHFSGPKDTVGVSLSVPVIDKVKVPNTVEEIKRQILAEYTECKNAVAGSRFGNNTREQIYQILYPALEVVKCIVSQSAGRGSKLAAFKGISFIGHLILRLLKRHVVSQVDGLGTFDENGARELSQAIDKVLFAVRALCVSFPPAELLMAPLLGASVSLKIDLHLYDRAHAFLENLLVDDSSTLCYSELLWSQLIQLRATLPDRDVDTIRRDHATVREARLSNQELHSRLSSFVCGKYVCPRHVHLHYDELIDREVPLAREFSDLLHNAAKSMSSLRKSNFAVSLNGICLGAPQTHRQTTLQNTESMCPASKHSPSTETDQSLVATRQQQNPGHLQNNDQSMSSEEAPTTITTIPYSLFWIGTSLSSLDLSSTQLHELPLCFGDYFTHLKRLDLSDNALSLLPSSFAMMEDLEELNVANNFLDKLPGNMRVRSLKRLDASNNKISHLPDCIRLCKLLEVLDMDHNPLNGLFWQFISQLPRLRSLKPRLKN